MKVLRYLIIIISILLLITIGVLVYYNKNIRNNEELGEPGEGIEEEVQKIKKVSNRQDYFTVRSIFYEVKMNINYLNVDISRYKIEQGTEEIFKENYKNKGLDFLASIVLSNNKEYSKNEIYNKFVDYANTDLKITNMFVYENDSNIKTYYIFTKDISNDSDFLFTFVLDNSNKTYGIDFSEYKEENIEGQIPTVKYTNEIEKNENNGFEQYNISEEQYIREMFEQYRYYITNNTNEAFNMLENEYRNKKFQNVLQFEKFINDNYNTLLSAKLVNYDITEDNNYTKYTLKDEFGNYYVFTEKSIMQYDVELDNYTIQTEEQINQYNSMSNENKVKYNLDIIKQAINKKDYKYLYERLVKDYRENYFPTYEEFEEYIKANFFDINYINFGQIEEKDEIYKCTMKVQNVNTEEILEKDLIIILNNNDFEFTFNK